MYYSFIFSWFLFYVPKILPPINVDLVIESSRFGFESIWVWPDLDRADPYPNRQIFELDRADPYANRQIFGLDRADPISEPANIRIDSSQERLTQTWPEYCSNLPRSIRPDPNIKIQKTLIKNIKNKKKENSNRSKPNPNLTRPDYALPISDLNRYTGHSGWSEHNPNSITLNPYPEILVGLEFGMHGQVHFAGLHPPSKIFIPRKSQPNTFSKWTRDQRKCVRMCWAGPTDSRSSTKLSFKSRTLAQDPLQFYPRVEGDKHDTWQI